MRPIALHYAGSVRWSQTPEHHGPPDCSGVLGALIRQSNARWALVASAAGVSAHHGAAAGWAHPCRGGTSAGWQAGRLPSSVRPGPPGEPRGLPAALTENTLRSSNSRDPGSGRHSPKRLSTRGCRITTLAVGTRVPRRSSSRRSSSMRHPSGVGARPTRAPRRRTSVWPSPRPCRCRASHTLRHVPSFSACCAASAARSAISAISPDSVAPRSVRSTVQREPG